MQRQHILVIRFSALGDVVMTVPVIYSLAHRYPHVRITVLSRSYARTFFEDLAPNVNFMEADVKVEYRGVKGLNALYRRLTAKQFTHVADLHNVLRSDYLRLRFNLGCYCVAHIDKHRSSRRLLTASPDYKQLQPLPTALQNYMDVFERLGFPVGPITFRSLFPPEGGNLNQLPRVVGPKRQYEQWIGVAPLAAHKGKIYPVTQMEQVIRQLIARYPQARIFLFGRGATEQQLFEQWEHQMPQCMSVGAHLEVMQQELILMSHLDVMVSMDSANMHIASLTATPVVSVWGATHPYAGFMGWNQPEEQAVQLELPCRPCSIFGQKPCRYGDYHCLSGIAPSVIAERVMSVIDSKQSREK